MNKMEVRGGGKRSRRDKERERETDGGGSMLGDGEGVCVSWKRG